MTENRTSGMNPDTTIYEEPSSLRVEDWEAFCSAMREEAERHPHSQNVLDTLQFAERMLEGIRDDMAAMSRREAA